MTGGPRKRGAAPHVFTPVRHGRRRASKKPRRCWRDGQPPGWLVMAKRISRRARPCLFLVLTVLLLTSGTALAQQPVLITVVSLTSPVNHGNTASIAIRTAPHATCDITVFYKSGPSRAQGLTPKAADSGGIVSWTWLVGSRTTPGTWPIQARCSLGSREGTLSTSFEVR